MERRCWVNFQCRGVLLVWMKVGQGPIVLAEGVGVGCSDIFSLVYLFSFLPPSLWETVRYWSNYCLKGPLNPNQPTNKYLSLVCISIFPTNGFILSYVYFKVFIFQRVCFSILPITLYFIIRYFSFKAFKRLFLVSCWHVRTFLQTAKF